MNIKRILAYGLYYALYVVGFYLLCIQLRDYFDSSIWKECLTLIVLWFISIHPTMNYIERKIDAFIPEK
jgi:hypothetical protein